MEKYSLNEIRKMFLDFFKSKGHTVLPAFSLVPHNDKSLLLINSGMAPLKNYFTGLETPPSKRVSTCQKCIRTPDIENVGKTARHGTFFEMLGNFSFGDYFKNEAISWAWEFFTNVLKIDKDILYVTVYEEDDEAYTIWHEKIGVAQDHIIRMGKEENFWEIGTGPCGPCSEIHVDRGPKYGCGKPDCSVGCECDRFIEIWNLVFTQFDKDEEGNYNPLAHPNIDTGMGLERISAFMQGVENIFEVDTIRYILDKVCSLANVKYGENAKQDVSIRVITDHLRSVVFMASDGIMPGNAGREYVMRRLLRRAIRHGKLLGIEGEFMVEGAKKVIEISKEAYPALEEKKAFILKVISTEEKKFNETINAGLGILEEMVEDLKKDSKTVLSGKDAFKLYDTFGFPVELTEEILLDNSMSLDKEAFGQAMLHQKQTAKQARENQEIESWKDELLEAISNIAPTKFVGYDTLEEECNIVAVIQQSKIVQTAKKGDKIGIIADTTPFYATSGGQVGDKGQIIGEGFLVDVTSTEKAGDKFVHYGVVKEGSVKVGKAAFKVDRDNRLSTCRNHTSTHLLQKALQMVLGDHVNQAGSMVDKDRLRFDFSHFEKLTDNEIVEVEKIVNNEILKATDVAIDYMSIAQAKEKGAMALFGEKYGDTVRVVCVPGFSMELCGGTHIDNIGKIGLFKIVSQSAVSSGVRRIEALTGRKAVEYAMENEAMLSHAILEIKANKNNFIQKLQELIKENKELAAIVKKADENKSGSLADAVISSKIQINSKNVVLKNLGQIDVNGARTLADNVKDRLSSVAGLFIVGEKGKEVLLCFASSDIVKEGFQCGAFIKALGSKFGFSGGGRDNMAQAGFKGNMDEEKLLQSAKDIFSSML